MRKLWIGLGIIIAALALAACSGEGDAAEAGGAETAEASGLEAGVTVAAEAAVEADSAVGPALSGGGGAVLPALGPRVIQTATLRLSVPSGRFDESVVEARSIAASVGGFVVSSTASQGPERRLVMGSLVVRVPEHGYAQAMRGLSRLGRVVARDERGQDVSQEFVDLEARGRHLEAVERQLLELLDRTDTVAAALAVQSKLNEVQLELEQVRGRLRFLRDQVAFATISLELRERGAVPVKADDGGAWGIVDAWRTAAHGFVTVVGWIFVAAATAAPLVLLLALALLAARFATRRRRLA
ncbi:MAG: DUF4349 domain-containing protein [Gaiellaceae bacterium]